VFPEVRVPTKPDFDSVGKAGWYLKVSGPDPISGRQTWRGRYSEGWGPAIWPSKGWASKSSR
jgi:hypothetical protein